MNGAHLHLLINHLPIVGTYVATLVLIGSYIFKDPIVRKTGLVIMLGSALLAIPAFLTGDPAEDVLKATHQANENFIEEHEEMAESTLWVSVITGAIALVCLIASIRNMQLANPLTIAVTIASITCSVLWIRVGNSGGEIRHPEIRDQNVKQEIIKDDD